MRASPSSTVSGMAGGPDASKRTSAQRCCSAQGPDVHIGVERACQRSQPATAGLTAHPSHDLADQVAVGVGVVGVARPGLPPRRGGGERRRHPVPVPQVVVGQRFAQRRHPGPVAERVPQRRLLLAPGGELRPDQRERIVQCNEPGIDQLEGEQGHERLPDRIEVDQRVVPPGSGSGGGGIGPAADQVDHRHAVEDDAQRRADFAPLGEVPGELFPHRAKPGVAGAGDRDVHAATLYRSAPAVQAGAVLGPPVP